MGKLKGWASETGTGVKKKDACPHRSIHPRFTPKRRGRLSCKPLAGLRKYFLLLQISHRALIAWSTVDLNRHLAVV